MNPSAIGPDRVAQTLEGHLGTSADVVLVWISDLRDADSPRLNGIDLEHARTLAGVEGQLPPICVHHESMAVIDGMHRVAAARLKGDERITARLFHGSEEEAFRLAVEANIAHGLPLTVAERQLAAERIIRSHPHHSDRSIAITTGLAAKTVAVIRRRTTGSAVDEGRVGRDGRVRPLSTAQGRRVASQAIEEHPGASLRDIARMAGVSTGTVRDVRNRIQAGKDPIPPQQRRAQQRSSSATAARSETRAQPAVDPVDVKSLLEGLRSDPSLRYTDSGRSLLRWMALAVPNGAHWVDVAYNIPPHCSAVVARIARECSRMWLQLAEELDRATRDAP